MNAFSIISSVSHAVTSTPYTFEPDSGVADLNPLNDPKPWLIRIWSDVGIHVRADGQAVTTDGCPVAAGYNGLLVSVPPGGSVSVVKQAGQADGLAWFTHVKRV